MKKLFSAIFFVLFCVVGWAQNRAADYAVLENISYIDAGDNYRNERCKLDIYYPAGEKDFATVVWFHGGGLEGGEKYIPQELKEKGIAVVAVNYRLSPKAKHPAYIEDAAAATAWTFKNIENYGGNPDLIFISGHSAGGYLTLMVGLDKKYLAAHGVDADKIKGLIPISGQTNTHYTIRKERGMPMEIPFVDEYAPLNRARKSAPPALLISGDRKLEMTARYEENLHLYAILKSLDNEVEIYEIEGFNHGNVVVPGCLLIPDFIKSLK